MGRSFQDARLFAGLTVFESVMVAADRSDRSGLFSSLFHAPWERWSERNHAKQVEEALRLLEVWEYRDAMVGDLPTGLRRTCDLAMVIVQAPRLVLLDEPTAGIPQADVEAFAPLIHRVRQQLNCAMLIIEHDMGLVMNLADRIYCLQAGRVIAEGTPQEVRSHPDVIATYLGTDAATIERSVTANQGRRAPRRNSSSDDSGGRRRPKSAGVKTAADSAPGASRH